MYLFSFFSFPLSNFYIVSFLFILSFFLRFLFILIVISIIFSLIVILWFCILILCSLILWFCILILWSLIMWLSLCCLILWLSLSAWFSSCAACFSSCPASYSVLYNSRIEYDSCSSSCHKNNNLKSANVFNLVNMKTRGRQSLMSLCNNQEIYNMKATSVFIIIRNDKLQSRDIYIRVK